MLNDDRTPQKVRAMKEKTKQYELKRIKRAGTRLAAVQALYEMEQTGDSANKIIRSFQENRFGIGPDENPVDATDFETFKIIINGVVAHQSHIDDAIKVCLAKGWKLSRLDATSRAILRAGGAEFIVFPNLDRPIIIDEYASLANDFFESGTETNFVNATLNSIGRKLSADGQHTDTTA